ncbi:MAG: glycosyltransferase family 4 protein [Elusimicrobiales bacterium]|nr:glycosyltransferase family 4 protein [Elusimicrobiales bacterium]
MENPKKIKSVLMLIATFHPLIGGTEKQALSLSASLVSRGIKVRVLTRKVGKTLARENMDGVLVRRIKTLGTGFIDSIFFMAASFFYLLKHSSEYDIIHVHLASSPAIAAIIAGKIIAKKVIIKLGGGKGVDEISLSKKTFAGRLKLKFFRFAKPILLVMNNDVLTWLKSTELGNLKLIKFRNGVDTGKYSPLFYHEKIKAKRRLGFENKQIFLFVGRLSPEKRIKEFVEIWAELMREGNFSDKVHFVIVGNGPDAAFIKDSVKTFDLGDSLTIAGSQTELLSYYNAADIFILPSLSEGLSNSMLEAMSCGLAIMASGVGGAKEAVKEGINGFLFDPFDKQKIKFYINKFLDDDKLALRMGEKSREIAVKKYSMAKVTDELLKIYEG